MSDDQECAVVWFEPWKHQHDENPVLPLLHAVVRDLELESREDVISSLKAISEALGSIVLSASTKLTVTDVRAAVDAYESENFRIRSERVRLDDYFSRLVTRALNFRHRSRLVVLIDDLDRCLPEQILGLLETLKLYLNRSDCVFFLAIDNKRLAETVAGKYGTLGVDGSDYLEKIVQLPFQMPRLSTLAFEGYLTALTPDGLTTALPVLMQGLRRNPRAVKRFVNTLILQDSLARSRGVAPYEVAVLAVVMLVRGSSPAFYAGLEEDTSLLRRVADDVETAAEGTTVEWDAKVVGLLETLTNAGIPVPIDVVAYIDLAAGSIVPAKAQGASRISADDVRRILALLPTNGRLDLPDADLRGEDLGNLSLVGAELRRANLSATNLRGTDLRRANLREADLREADLRGASLRGADLRGASLRDADLRGADLRDADLRDADLGGADLRDADWTGAQMDGAYLTGTALSGGRAPLMPDELNAAATPFRTTNGQQDGTSSKSGAPAESLDVQSDSPSSAARRDGGDAAAVIDNRVRNIARTGLIQSIKAYWSLPGSIESLMQLKLVERPDLSARFADSVGQRNSTRWQGGRISQHLDEFGGDVFILGPPGSGKTTLLLTLCSDLLDRAESDPLAPIPVILSLATWRFRELSFDRWLIGEVSSLYGIAPSFTTIFRSEGIAYLFDDIDELAPEARRVGAKAIADLRSRISPTPTAVTCRTLEGMEVAPILRPRTVVELLPLEVNEIRHFIARDEQLPADARQSLEFLLGNSGEIPVTPLLVSLGLLALKSNGRRLSAEDVVKRYVEVVCDQLAKQSARSPSDIRQLLSVLAWYQIEAKAAAFTGDEREIRDTLRESGLRGIQVKQFLEKAAQHGLLRTVGGSSEPIFFAFAHRIFLEHFYALHRQSSIQAHARGLESGADGAAARPRAPERKRQQTMDQDVENISTQPIDHSASRGTTSDFLGAFEDVLRRPPFPMSRDDRLRIESVAESVAESLVEGHSSRAAEQLARGAGLGYERAGMLLRELTRRRSG